MTHKFVLAVDTCWSGDRGVLRWCSPLDESADRWRCCLKTPARACRQLVASCCCGPADVAAGLWTREFCQPTRQSRNNYDKCTCRRRLWTRLFLRATALASGGQKLEDPAEPLWRLWCTNIISSRIGLFTRSFIEARKFRYTGGTFFMVM